MNRHARSTASSRSSCRREEVDRRLQFSKESTSLRRWLHRSSKFLNGLSAVGFAVLALALRAVPLAAHDGPEHTIEELTDQMARLGASAELLVERATEYRILGKLTEAAGDLESALRFKPEFLPAEMELSRIYLAQGKTNLALTTINHALGQPAPSTERGPLHIVRAEIYRAQHDYRKALADCDSAFREHTGELDWYLMRSQLQAQLGRNKARLTGLEQGIKATGSGVLETEWIDALIDAGQHKPALERIEAQLKDSRWQSSWLIRRARVRIGLGQRPAAREDLKSAVVEINQRLTPSSPDLTLLTDRGFASALLGDEESAKKDFQSARDAGAEEWVLSRLEAHLGLKTR